MIGGEGVSYADVWKSVWVDWQPMYVYFTGNKKEARMTNMGISLLVKLMQ